MPTPGVDHPHRDGEVEVMLPEHRVSVSARVEAADAATVVLRPSVGDFPGQEAVRGRLVLPLTVTVDGVELQGDVLDLSETGIRAVVDAYGPPPSPGATVAVVLQLEDDALVTRAEVVRYQVRRCRWTLSLRFTALPEQEQDRLRRRVFRAMREDRARAI